MFTKETVSWRCTTNQCVRYTPTFKNSMEKSGKKCSTVKWEHWSFPGIKMVSGFILCLMFFCIFQIFYTDVY